MSSYWTISTMWPSGSCKKASQVPGRTSIGSRPVSGCAPCSIRRQRLQVIDDEGEIARPRALQNEARFGLPGLRQAVGLKQLDALALCGLKADNGVAVRAHGRDFGLFTANMNFRHEGKAKRPFVESAHTLQIPDGKPYFQWRCHLGHILSPACKIAAPSLCFYASDGQPFLHQFFVGGQFVRRSFKNDAAMPHHTDAAGNFQRNGELLLHQHH
ncbi:hypothetical protein C047_02820 [Brucella melitensis Uk24/06]|nr:hypothetical protein C047_02820 [Brucella melitensis Uk24/06]